MGGARARALLLSIYKGEEEILHPQLPYKFSPDPLPAQFRVGCRLLVLRGGLPSAGVAGVAVSWCLLSAGAVGGCRLLVSAVCWCCGGCRLLVLREGEGLPSPGV